MIISLVKKNPIHTDCGDLGNIGDLMNIVHWIPTGNDSVTTNTDKSILKLIEWNHRAVIFNLCGTSEKKSGALTSTHSLLVSHSESLKGTNECKYELLAGCMERIGTLTELTPCSLRSSHRNTHTRLFVLECHTWSTRQIDHRLGTLFY